MANDEHLAGLKNGVGTWNLWRGAAPEVRPDLFGADLRGANLRDADLRNTTLRGADLRGADLRDARLRDSDLRDANFAHADLSRADLRRADLSGADLRDANLRGAELRGAIHTIGTKWPQGFNPPSGALGLSTGELEPKEDFSIRFHPDLSPQQVKAVLEALADYFRSCGGAGLRVRFELQSVSVGEPEYAGR